MPAAVVEPTSDVRPSRSRRPFRFSLFLRRCHMYLGLFLTPWLTMYALSTIVFNHWGRINQYYGGKMGQYEPEKEVPYHKAFGAHVPLRERVFRFCGT